MIYNYKTENTCSSNIKVEIDGNIVRNIEFTCGRRPTSCADQLAHAVRAAYEAAQDWKEYKFMVI